MKRLFLATVAFTALASSAFAADLPARTYTKAPAYVPAPIYNWTGFYVGGNIGGAFRDGDDPFGGGNRDRFIGGGQVGANFQFSGNWLFGIEVQYDAVDNSTGAPFVIPGGTFGHELRGLGSVTGRLGYTSGPSLLYVKGGYAYADRRDDIVGPFLFNDHRDGYTVGAGVEYMFAQNWSGMIEYQFYGFGRSSMFTGVPLVFAGSEREDEHTVKAGLNYHFDWTGPFSGIFGR